jgi:hypothetical protein
MVCRTERFYQLNCFIEATADSRLHKFSFKKRHGKDKPKAPSQNPGESSQTTLQNSIVASRRPPRVVSPDRGDFHRETTENTIAAGIRDVQIGRPRQASQASRGGDDTLSPHGRLLDRYSDPLGLTILHEPETTPSLDIIFVHGLGGTSRATWSKGHDPEFFWPHKWLPLEPGIQSARISSFGYNANFATAGPTPITNITDFARDLLYAMKFAKDPELEEANIGEVICTVFYSSQLWLMALTCAEADHFYSSLYGWFSGQKGKASLPFQSSKFGPI